MQNHALMWTLVPALCYSEDSGNSNNSYCCCGDKCNGIQILVFSYPNGFKSILFVGYRFSECLQVNRVIIYDASSNRVVVINIPDNNITG